MAQEYGSFLKIYVFPETVQNSSNPLKVDLSTGPPDGES